MAIRDRLTDGEIAFTRAELKIVRQLLSNYPAAGLNTVAHLAAAADVSNPTVVRFANKLGFEGYPEFQAALLSEVQERMSSPLSMLDTRKPSLEQENFYQYFLRASIHALEASMQMLPPDDFEAAIDAAADLNMRVHCLGGRFSGFLAGLLWSHMKQLRGETRWINGSQADQVDQLVDLGKRDVLFVYDYRRYQIDTIRFARQAAKQGARIVLFTDRWVSPIAEFASVTLMAPVDTVSPYDTMVPAIAQTEALIAGLTARLANQSRGRIERMEELRRSYAITEDAYSPPVDGSK
ncbi:MULTISPECIES: MurR/RpiR family transcriptional regulator [Rhizobiaceae]|jgi:DNA-binding MurR/RpiR family transcriptional regulator|uniref:MurR/RpiR family transcriptional regulator n=1 Tax=Agrobacterium pusense TaxID=648995 RepID=A0AA44EFF4_9HYPH|nr:MULTISPECIES: MurR/RpiR family transcriptional regulator [Rhizobiaceae]MCO5154475.1 MurR/RpiR family transcriptional regulator [Shinella sp.]MDC7264397.1 MurR/RpiR family transcriptional regulator [Shinella sp. HY16]MDC7271293.1 MurR/RpiR family transcriptional regulator [Shinella sp. YZ44]MDG4675922.1 MurR/RpiR family transcriptional regulator [Shinella sp. 838]NRF17685.1 MurR/RpiR family transcriptional regulator [Agrobacterium pusense]